MFLVGHHGILIVMGILLPMSDMQRNLLCDPQTSGGLLIAVKPSEVSKIKEIAQQQGVLLQSIGKLLPHQDNVPLVEVID